MDEVELRDYLREGSKRVEQKFKEYRFMSPEQREERHESLRRLRVDAALVVKSMRFGKDSVYCS